MTEILIVVAAVVVVTAIVIVDRRRQEEQRKWLALILGNVIAALASGVAAVDTLTAEKDGDQC